MNYPLGLLERINGVRLNEPLAEHTTFKIGGPAEFWVEPQDTAELNSLIKAAKNKNIPIFVIGAGSNILCVDSGIKGAVISLNSDYFRKIETKKDNVLCGAGVRLASLVERAHALALGGIEFLSGIPGTVGGALTMNAGISESVRASKCQSVKEEKIIRKIRSIGDMVEEVSVMDCAGNIMTLKRKELNFSYRRSNLSGYIIIDADFKLFKKDKEEIKNEINKYLAHRKRTQDISSPSAGCIFRNPNGDSAGRLIDLCGLKGKSIGDAFISLKHANFILNKGRAKAEDVLTLIDVVKKEVKNRFNINLETEIKIW